MHNLIKKGIAKSNIFITIISDMQELSFHRKHFSHSIKRLLPHLAASNPESPSKPSTLNLSSSKSPHKHIRRVKVREGESYEKIVDDIMKRHV